MNWIKRIFADRNAICLIIGMLWLGVDFLNGASLVKAIFPQAEFLERDYRTGDLTYDHTLVANYDGLGQWGHERYRVCTDLRGFKISCNDVGVPRDSADIVFIGDSFTEGVGLTYEDSFVGRIAKARPDLVVANMGVASYSPSIYLAKVRKYLNAGYKFKELVVYLDVSDIQDEALDYKYVDGIVTSTKQVPARNKFVNIAYIFFPLTTTTITLLIDPKFAAPKEKGDFFGRDYPRSAWTYHDGVGGFGDLGVNGAIERSLHLMGELHDLLSKNGIALSIGVYPWPGQILYDKEESRHVQIWRDFCQTRCARFYNSFPTFFAMAEKYGKSDSIDEFFIKGDVHHNAEGARLIAEDFLTAYPKSR